MPTYRIQPRQGDRQTVQGHRLRSEGEQVFSVDRIQGKWQPVLELHLDEVGR